MKKNLVVVILTYNESIHIERAIKNVKGWADQIIVLDSYSQDSTVEKAQALGAEILQRKFDHYKNQRQYAIDYCKDKTEWMLFLDADEYLLPELKQEIQQAIQSSDVVGYHLKRRCIFMDKWIKHGGYYPTYLLRLFQPEKSIVEGIVNEHILVSGKVRNLYNDFVDENLKGIGSWIDKHNRYASYEAERLFLAKKGERDVKAKFWGSQSERKQWLRQKIWNKLPRVIFRPLIYFIYRYFIRLGFLDGKPGFIYHFLQGYWFWVLTDLKYLELKKKTG